MFRPFRIAPIALAMVIAPCAAYAQGSVINASVTGRVVDPSGALVPHARVTATSAATHQVYAVVTDKRGRFRLPFLPAGTYAFLAQAAGFTAEAQQMHLSVGAAFDVTLHLSVGAQRASVNVAAHAPVLEEDRSQISETISQAEVNGLPFNGRNFLDLALLAPGVSPTNTNSVQMFAETSPVVGQGYSINSQRNLSNSFVVDGLSANDDAAGLAGNFYPMDVIAEFQVVTSGGQAEFGRALGGYFNIVTRSGSNDLHGTMYGFLRNQRLNARNPLSQNKLPFTQGQYGASLSGPVRRDRTFFFANYEARRLQTDGVSTITSENATAINTRLDQLGFGGLRIQASNGPATLYPTSVHTDNAFARLDHHFSDVDQMNARYSYYRLDSTNARGAGGLADVSFGTAVRDANHTFAISNIASLTSHLFNETRGQFTYDDLSAPSNTQNSPAITISGVATFGRFSSSPTARVNSLYEVVNNLVLQHGAHTLKTGIDFLFNRDTITFPMSIAGAYTFSSLAAFQSNTTGYSLFTQNFGSPYIQQNNPNTGIYVQDEWKATAAFTLNLGFRYDLQWLRTIHTDTNNVSPRVGFAWSPFVDKRTVMRGSFGLFYDRVPLRALANALLSAGNTTDPAQGRLLQYTYVSGDTGAPVFPQVSSTPNPGSKISYALMDRHLQNASSLQASFGVEQQLSRNATLGISYQHVQGMHLLTSVNTNINPDGTRPDNTRGNIKLYSSLFDSYFDGLEVSLVKRPSSWSSARVSYTWSKAIDNVGQFFFSSPINNFDLKVDRSRSDNDQRHRLVVDGSISSSTSQAHSVLQHVTHNWKLSGFMQYYSRLPFNITTGGQTKQQTAQRPCVSGYTLSQKNGVNPCTEAVQGTVIGRNAGIGFDFFNVNTRLSRTFVVIHRLRLEAIAEAFNVLNHRNDMIPNGIWGTLPYPASPTKNFGAATAVGDPRSFQLGARISF
ncbi:MAG: TonB-dependent receptor [Acidobacteria bacterium]|nr:TonB-dependent receptor [Acidobacteriota bacterium]